MSSRRSKRQEQAGSGEDSASMAFEVASGAFEQVGSTALSMTGIVSNALDEVVLQPSSSSHALQAQAQAQGGEDIAARRNKNRPHHRRSFFNKQNSSVVTQKKLVWRNVNVTLKSKKKKKKQTTSSKKKSDDDEENVDITIVKEADKSGAPAPAGDDIMVAKRILDNVWGDATAGELTAIMGPSGAGKTSLFHVLAGRIKTKGRIEVNADIRLSHNSIDDEQQEQEEEVEDDVKEEENLTDENKNASVVARRSRVSSSSLSYRLDPSRDTKLRQSLAFVAQQDSLHPAFTPKQTLFFSARLRLPRDVPDEEIHELVDQYIEELGLSSCVDTICKRLSGGEKRRVSIGIELISQPQIIFLDEPTSGLDSYAARQVMDLLRKMAQAGNIVLFTIHQPSSEIFNMFDKLVLLNQGRLMYQGHVSDLSGELQELGYGAPHVNFNLAEWLLDLAQRNSVQDLETGGFFPKDPRILDDNPSTLKNSVLSNMTPTSGGEPNNKTIVVKTASQWTQLKLLMSREKAALTKNPAAMIISLVITVIMSVIYGIIFYKIGEKDRAQSEVVQSQLGALVNVNIATMMGQTQPAMVLFAVDRPLFLREYSTRHYGVVPYFISKLASEAFQALVIVFVQDAIAFNMMKFQQRFLEFLATTYSLGMTATALAVFVGAFFSRAASAKSMLSLVVIPQYYFSGLFIAINLIPRWIRWIQYICSLTFASRIGFAYEFEDCDPGLADVNCQNILDQNNVDQDDVWWYWLALVGLFVVFRLGAVVVLKSRASNFDS